MLVYCTKCGRDNPDGSKFCSNCGNPLYPGQGEPVERRVEGPPYRRHEREMCFGISGGFWALIIGVAIVLWGISEIVRIYYRFDIPWWPIIVVIIGIFILVRATSRRI